MVEEWGDTERVDMCFSVAKSFLSAVAGLAFDRGLIADLHEPVVDGGITWHHLLQQTSQWEGTLWGKPTCCDPASDGVAPGPPGSAWGYNDVRVNLLALELLRRWRRPLPDVLRDELMDPIGASDTWRWHGYRNSYVTIDGQRMQSVSGGGHWGGGVWASTRDRARFGMLYLRRAGRTESQPARLHKLDPEMVEPSVHFLCRCDGISHERIALRVNVHLGTRLTLRRSHAGGWATRTSISKPASCHGQQTFAELQRTRRPLP